jgi:hypothetical protein
MSVAARLKGGGIERLISGCFDCPVLAVSGQTFQSMWDNIYFRPHSLPITTQRHPA